MQFCSTRRSRSRAGLAAVLAVAALTGFTPALRAEAPEHGYVVIVSKSVAVDGLSSDELRRILTFKRTLWKTGQTINLLLPGAALPSRTFILTKMYRMSDDELRRFILQRIFQAEIDFAPKVVTVERDAVAFVASGTSMLAIVSAGTPGLGSVKVLRIDGRLPGEAGYSLQ